MFGAMTTTTGPGSPPRSIYVLAAHPHWRDSRVNRRLLEAVRELPGIDVNDLYSSYPDYDDRRRGRAGPRGARRPAGAAAPDPVVLDAAAAEALAGRGADLRLGLRRAAARRCRARTVAGRDHRRVGTSATTRRATTAISSTPSCRPTSRPPRCAACASCRRCCCTVRAARRTRRVTAHVEVFKERLLSLSATGPNWRTWRLPQPARCPTTDRPHEQEEA